MKTILIEAVNRGWIVRPFQFCSSWATDDKPDMHVFTDMQDLQRALPALLEEDYEKKPSHDSP